MSERRRLLMAIANSYKWLPYSYEYLYHNLIPEKIATFNKWNEEWELGYIDSTGNKASSGNIRSKDYIKVEPNGTYYFKCPISGNVFNVICYNVNKQYLTTKYPTSNTTLTMPNNCCYIRFYLEATYGTTYNHDICINESNASLNGTYIPYKPRYVKDKSKFAKFEGNSEVVNQLLKELSSTNWQSSNASVSFSNGVATFTATVQYGQIITRDNINVIGGHKYMAIYTIKLTTASSYSSIRVQLRDGTGPISFAYLSETTNRQTIYGILEARTSYDSGYIRVIDNRESGWDSVEVSNIMLIDLTQAYPFDTPTTLTDSRVQNIIRKGYIPHNTGEIKDTDMGGIIAESFNLFNEEWEWGYIDSSTGAIISYAQSYKTTDFIEILPNTEYYCKATVTGIDTPNIAYYDENKQFILFKGSVGSFFNHTFTTPSGVRYIRITITLAYVEETNFCINRSSSLNGTYKPHDDFVDLAHFNPIDINGIHDEFKALDSGYLFRKKTLRVDLGSLTWAYETTGNTPYFYSTSISTITKKPVSNYVKADLNCSLENQRAVDIRMNGYYGIAIDDVGNIRCALENMGTDPATFKTMVSGIMLDFPLASEQTTNMPLRHLGMVKLGDLSNWSLNSGRFANDSLVSTIKAPASESIKAKVYIASLLTISYSEWNASTSDLVIYISTSGGIRIVDKSCSTTDSFLAKHGNDYLYFETQDVVDETDILTYTGILPLKYQGSGFGTSHDTMEETDTEWVFTRRKWKKTLDTLNWNYNSGNNYYTSSDLRGTIENASSDNSSAVIKWLCSSANPTYADNVYVGNFGFAVDSNGTLYFKNSTTDSSTQPSGQFEFELANPQITRIPKKHINVVKFKDLEWVMISSEYYPNVFRAKISSKKMWSNNIFCEKYMTVEANILGQATGVGISGDLRWFGTGVGNQLAVGIRDTNYSDATTFKNHFTDNDILYYETTDESTLPDTFSIQAGGEVSSYAFEWVENQQVNNGNFPSTDGWAVAYGSVSVANNKGTFTITDANNSTRLEQRNMPFVSSHKYLLLAQITPSASTDYVIREDVSNIISGTFVANTKTNVQTIFTSIGGTYLRFYVAINSTGSVGNSYVFENAMLVDLTQAFGSGNEPTSTSDHRIQRIIEKGYIPTNTNGTLVFEETEVLPNFTGKNKCK